MGIRGLSSHAAQAPKALCPSCRRPVAVLKTGRCAYCGTGLPGARPEPIPASAIPPEVLVALEPRARTVSTESKWLRRIIALGVAGLLTALVAGPCMKS